MASEESFLDLVIANQRILEWVDQLQGPQRSAGRKKHIILQLKDTVQEKAAYAEEAQRSGVVPVLTSILRATDDEEVMDAISSIISACNGPLASGGQVSDFCYDGTLVRIREGALGDGLGAKVWTVAHMLCRLLAKYPGFVRGHAVLEIGAGCGVCGILAARLGAERVDLTDVEGPVLRNLRECMHLTLEASRGESSKPSSSTSPASKHAAADKHSCSTEGYSNDVPAHCSSSSGKAGHGPGELCGHKKGAAGAAPVKAGQPQQQLPSDADLFDDAESVSDDADLGALTLEDTRTQGDGDGKGCGGQESGPDQGQEGFTSQGVAQSSSCPKSSWEGGNMHVRFLDWLESLLWQQQQQQQQKQQQQPQQSGTPSHSVQEPIDPEKFYAGDILRTKDTSPQQGHIPPPLDPHLRYSRIIGTDVMYEPMHATLVAAVLAHRLAPGGCALLCCAVRQQCTFDAFQGACASQGLRYRWRQVEPEAGGSEGIGARRKDYEQYEGGFLLMAIDHKGQPCSEWGVPVENDASFSDLRCL